MKKLIYLTLISFLAACSGNREQNENQPIEVVNENAGTERTLPVFNGKIDTLKLKTVLAHYFTVKNALIDGNANAAAITGKEASELMKDEQDEVLKSIGNNFKLIGESVEIGDQRKYFYPLSEAMFAVTIKIKPDTATLYKQYCPMAFDDTGAWWISDEEEVVNPYFGEEMLHCGMVQKQW